MEDGKAQNFILHVFIFLLSPCVIYNKFGFLSKKMCQDAVKKN